MKARKSFLLRMNPDLYREIEAWAQQEMRSVNSQIEFLLRQAVTKRLKNEKNHKQDNQMNDNHDEKQE